MGKVYSRCSRCSIGYDGNREMLSVLELVHVINRASLEEAFFIGRSTSGLEQAVVGVKES